MIFLGILWVTSWIGSVLSLNESLPPNMTSKLNPTKASANLGMVNKPLPFFVLPQVNVWNATVLPTNFLRMDWGAKKPRTTLEKAPNYFKQGAKNSKNQFCRSVQEILVNEPRVTTPKVVSSALIPSVNGDFLPSKILRSLQNFFRLSNLNQPNFSSDALPVVVVQRDEKNYEVWLNNRLIANLPNKLQANLMQQRLTRMLKTSSLDATQLRPAVVDGKPALMAGNRLLFGIEKQVSQKANRNGDLLAIDWINNLRQALQAPGLSLVQAQLEMYGLKPSKQKMSGLASWYGGYFHGRLTANGEIYNQDEFTVAHKSLPFNTYLQVTNLKTNKAVIVRVNDRGPYIPPRSLDLSRVAARCLNSVEAGVVPYKAVIMQQSQPKMTMKNGGVANQNQKSRRKLTVISDF